MADLQDSETLHWCPQGTVADRQYSKIIDNHEMLAVVVKTLLENCCQVGLHSCYFGFVLEKVSTPAKVNLHLSMSLGLLLSNL